LPSVENQVRDNGQNETRGLRHVKMRIPTNSDTLSNPHPTHGALAFSQNRGIVDPGWRLPLKGMKIK